MMKPLLRMVKHVLAAVVLLALIVCAVECWLRGQRCLTCYQDRVRPLSLDQLLIPSRVQYQELPENFHAKIRNLEGDVIELRINSMHCRGPEFSIPKPAKTYRVLVLGDDTLFAPEVSEEDSFCGQLRQFLQESIDLRVEVINAAIPGGCPFRYLLQVRHGLSIAQPDLVLVHFDLSDIADTRAQRRFALLNKEGQTVTAIHPSFDARTPALTEPVEREFLAVELARKKLACWMQTRGKSSTQPTDWENPAGRYYWLHDNQPFREADQRVFQPLAELRNLLNDLSSSAVPLVVCTSPKPWQVSPTGGGERLRTAAGLPLNRQIDSTSVSDVLSDFCQTESVPLIDVSSRFRTAADRDDLFFDEAEALSPAGHQLYAQAVAQELRKRGLTLAR